MPHGSLIVRREARTLQVMIPSRSGLGWLAPLALGALLAAGCAPSYGNPTTLPSSPTAVAATSTPAVPATSAGECGIPSGQPDLPGPGNDAAVDGILAYLNAGGTVSALSDRLHATGLAGRPQDSKRLLDLNEDGWQDVALALSGPPATAGGPVILLLCEGDHYVLGAPLAQGESGTVPILHAGTDLTGDTAADVLVGWRVCGAHTCQERLEVLSVSDTRVIRHGLDPSSDLPFPEIAILTDGSVAATATGVGSVGAGPFRRLTRTWAWDSASQAFRLISKELEPPRYRIHVLLDADAAARQGDLETALDLYHRVVLDDSLVDWIDPSTERANLTGYAMFRVILTYVQMNDEGDAQKAYGILQNQFPSGAVGRAYASMAQAFWDSHVETDGQARGCQAAIDFAASHADEILAPLYFGYANPVYTAADMCVAEGP